MDGRRFLEVLSADGPAADRKEKMMLYGQFIGDWLGNMVFHDDKGTRREIPTEVHFAWALEGRAIQDVWITPALKDRKKPEHTFMYGSTFRVYDPRKDNWHIIWIDPVQQSFLNMTGQKIGDDIVQEYRREDGTVCQWMFTEITADYFHWINRESKDSGASWKIIGEFYLSRSD